MTETIRYVHVKYGAIRTVKWLIRDQYYVVSCVFQKSYCYDCGFFSLEWNKVKNKTVTTKRAYTALFFLWIFFCFTFVFVAFSKQILLVDQEKKWFDRFMVVFFRVKWCSFEQKAKQNRQEIYVKCSCFIESRTLWREKKTKRQRNIEIKSKILCIQRLQKCYKNWKQSTIE